MDTPATKGEVMDFIIITTRNHPSVIAFERGQERGKGDKEAGYRNESPLSGEWAGESIPELLGDLIIEFADGGSNEQELCDLYEAGYNEAFDL
jgi:hypothetical protein